MKKPLLFVWKFLLVYFDVTFCKGKKLLKYRLNRIEFFPIMEMWSVKNDIDIAHTKFSSFIPDNCKVWVFFHVSVQNLKSISFVSWKRDFFFRLKHIITTTTITVPRHLLSFTQQWWCWWRRRQGRKWRRSYGRRKWKRDKALKDIMF